MLSCVINMLREDGIIQDTQLKPEKAGGKVEDKKKEDKKTAAKY